MSKQNNDTASKITPLNVRHEPDPAVDPSDYRIDKELVAFVQEEPFFGAISMYVPKVSDWKVDTAYVCADKQGNVKMGYNPDFMYGIPSKHKIGVIMHELCHVTLMHIAERCVADRSKSRLWNIATDLAIDSIIGEDRLPSFCLMPGRAPQTDDPKLAALIVGFPKLQSADWYMARLEEYAEKNGKKNAEGEYELSIGNENGETLDGHGGWGDIPDEMRDIIREQVREMIEKGAQAAHQRGSWGSIPSEMQAQIEAMLKHELDWKAILRMFIGRTRSMERQSTMKRINKRLPYMMPGARRSTTANVLCAIDQSGSVSDEDVQRFLAETFAASKEGKIDIVNFDTDMDESSLQSVTNGQNFKWARTRCGGTDFDAVQRYLNNSRRRGKYSACLIMTDGYAPKMGAVVGTKVMWVITETGDISAARPGDLVVKMGAKDKAVKRV